MIPANTSLHTYPSLSIPNLRSNSRMREKAQEESEE
ncbi:uncharacterized protein G2W53_044386 [Senna tora]|uniref:Uncharacterized protein n=1 Tax=Senna tora TaxID=362788 RepID=A0A834SMS8_9FABA|nr:uncharacterized protein G2W53_044386 [Senna tora]